MKEKKKADEEAEADDAEDMSGAVEMEGLKNASDQDSEDDDE